VRRSDLIRAEPTVARRDLATLDMRPQTTVVTLEHGTPAKPFRAQVAFGTSAACAETKEELQRVPLCRASQKMSGTNYNGVCRDDDEPERDAWLPLPVLEVPLVEPPFLPGRMSVKLQAVSDEQQKDRQTYR